MLVDDVRFAVEGPPLKVRKSLLNITSEVVRVIEGDLLMEMSRDKEGKEGKTVGQASCVRMERLLAPGLGKLGIRMKKKVRNLGVDFGVGKVVGRKGTSVFAGRVKEGWRRVRRAQLVGAAGKRTAIRMVVAPSQSIPQVNVKMLTTEMARAYGPTQGRSVTTRLIVEGVDPLQGLVEKAVMMWVCAVWDKLVEQEVLKEAWRMACVDKMMGARGGASRQGGAAAMWDALEKLGWAARASMSSG